MEKGLGKEMMRFRLSVIFWVFGVDVGRCTDKPWQFPSACAMVFLPKIRPDDCDVII